MPFKFINNQNFKAAELQKIIPASELTNLVKGDLPVIVVRNFLRPEICDKISENFDAFMNSRSQTDGVPGNYVGSYHYNKMLCDYFREVDQSSESLASLFKNVENPIISLQSKLKNIFSSQEIKFRIAEHQNKKAGNVVARKWTDMGDYSLKPHDDFAQLNSPMQKGFEIQKVQNFNVVGVNICINNAHKSGGDLIIWNCIADDYEREILGIENSGYPYPLDYLERFDSIKIEVRKGDLYFLNSSLVHAVGSQPENVRLTISFLMGKIDNNTIIYWT